MKVFFAEAFSFYLKLFFLLTPFFIIGMFISMTDGIPSSERRRLARNVALCTMMVCLIIFLFGAFIMRIFDITVDAFRAGSGVLLMLTAISAVMRQPEAEKTKVVYGNIQEMALVPMAVPMTAGPAVLGTLMVAGTDAVSMVSRFAIVLAIVLATSSIGVCLVFADKIEKLLGHARIIILSKLTGLILGAIAAQMIVYGCRGLWEK